MRGDPPRHGEGDRREAVVEGVRLQAGRRAMRPAPAVSPSGRHLPVPGRTIMPKDCIYA